MEYMAKRPPGKPSSGAHGGGVRGDQVNRGSRTFEGRFGRMFRALPAAEFNINELTKLGEAMSADPEEKDIPGSTTSPKQKQPIAPLEVLGIILQDAEENSGIPAGYTYFGQFIDHDITFDPASSLQKQNDPDALVDFRTPALDLDSVYGRGPEDQPYMFEQDGKTFRLGKHLLRGNLPSKSRDLPRLKSTGERDTQGNLVVVSPARAIIGDKRNDENVIVSQLQGVFLQFHNRLVRDHPGVSFKEIQRKVRWHYQYIVLNDFLPRIVGQDTMDRVWVKRLGKPNLSFYKFHQSAYMPIEFAAAAYRFGHSMVRPIYRLNTEHTALNAGEDEGLAGRFFIFAGVQKRGLNGFDEFPSDWAIDWNLYFDIAGSGTKAGKERVQPAYKFDTSLVNPLAFLPEFSVPALPNSAGSIMTVKELQSVEDIKVPPSPNNLAVRNLWRGNSMGLPSGQDVARAMSLVPLKDSELFVGKATHENVFGNKKNKLLTKISPEFAGKAPLWFYILAESLAGWTKAVTKAGHERDDIAADKIPTTLGPVGGRIVAETLLGLALADSHSYLNQEPLWVPEVGTKKTDFKMGDLVEYALG